MPAPNSRTRSDRTSRMGGPKVTTTSPKSMREHAEAHATSIAVKREKNQREASRAAAHEHESEVARTAPLGSSKKSKAGRAAAQAHESEVARTDTRCSSKMPQDWDAQFLEDTEKAVQQSLISKADAHSKYESNIDMLNQQLIKLRPDAIQLQVEDVKAEYSQEDCLFAAIIMQYKARCRALPGMEVHHACLESVKAFRQAIMRWVQTYEDIV
jgi:hypothetical protein